MSEQSFKNFMRSKCTTISLALIMATAANASANITAQQKEKIKKETKDFIQGKTKELEIPLDSNRTFHYAKFKHKIKLSVITGENNSAFYDSKTTESAKKEYKKDQKDAFKYAPFNESKVKSPQDFVKEYNENDGKIITGLYYSQNKHIVQFEFSGTQQEINEAFKNLNLEKSDSTYLEQIKKRYENYQSTNNVERTAVHENQHKVNDKNNIYAPGLNAMEYGKLNCWDECSANLAQLILENHKYQKALSAGKTQEEALKEFSERFSFYKDAVAKGLNPDSNETKELMVQGTIKMWKTCYQKPYEYQTINQMQHSPANTVGLIIGNEEDYKQRVNQIFDSFDENPKLQKLGITIGKLSQYLPAEDFELSEKCMEAANQLTLKKTGFSLEEGKQISQELPGVQEEDQKALAKLISDPEKLLELSGRISAALSKTAQNENITQTKTQQQTNSGIVNIAMKNSAER